MANEIVTISVSQRVAATPSDLQQKGALISAGSTTASAGSQTLLTELADLTAILKAPAAITSMAWSANVVTVTTTTAHGLPNGSTFPVTIAGVTPAGYNGNFTATVTGASTFTYPKTPDPGAVTVQGTWILRAVAETLAMGTTFFAQGDDQAVYLLELGPLTVVNAVAALTTYLTDNPNSFYAYLVPAAWAADTTFDDLVNAYTGLTKKTYFFIPATSMTYAPFADMKSAFTMVSAPAAPSTEFSAAASLFDLLANRASGAFRVPPFAFRYQFGVTNYPPAGNGALFATLKAAAVNIVGTGAEGGISNKVLFWGTTMDGRDMSYWYAVDWAQINLEIDLANDIINGSNSQVAPLYYNQQGINRLQAVAQATLDRAVTFGLIQGGATVDAIDFATYVAANPDDYPTGTYNGLSATVTPQGGFKSITFALVISDLIAA